MEPIVIFCCSFARDLLRARRMAESVARHNRDALALYVSAPREDVALFRRTLGSLANVIDRDAIVAANPRMDMAKLYALPGIKTQQVIKSDFWRLGLAENTLVLDSDCKFIRDFSRGDFLAEASVPFTVMHDGRDVLEFTARHGPRRVREEFLECRVPVMRELGREGEVHDYGYAPYIWSRHVWSDLAEKYLAPRGETLAEAIDRAPSEFTWYGEALLRFRSIPLHRRGEYFRFYHYEHQYWADRRRGVTEEALAADWLGVVYQSNWETSTRYGPPGKSLPSRMARSVKRAIKYALQSARS
jgi:hypothetical protein